MENCFQVPKVSLSPELIAAIWLPTLVTNSEKIITPENILDFSLALDIEKVGSDTRVSAVFEVDLENSCDKMSFWNYPFDGFKCEFYLRHRHLPQNELMMVGTIHTRPELQTPSEFSMTYLAFEEKFAIWPPTNTNYSITGFTIEFDR